MAEQVLALLVASAILTSAPAAAQPTTQLQDLSIQAVLGPVQSAGDLAMDSAGSLWLVPTFGVLATGLGAFVPASPTDLAPWSATYPLPNPYLGIPITLEAYVLTPQAANGLFQISNHIDVQL